MLLLPAFHEVHSRLGRLLKEVGADLLPGEVHQRLDVHIHLLQQQNVVVVQQTEGR